MATWITLRDINHSLADPGSRRDALERAFPD
jgi:hypothetical protein